MLDSVRLTALAEAIADGEPLDWAAEESNAIDGADRELIAKLRAVASVGQLFATLSSGPMARPARRNLLTPGSSWGALRVLEHVGRGRFGDVYRAWDPALDREVALKIQVDGECQEAADTQVVEEGRLMARVRHEHVIAIHGAQRIDGMTGLWMEFVEGRTLAEEFADRGPFDADTLAQAGIELCHALGAVHDAGLVHRDVKAQNVMRDSRGRLKLGDFGTGHEFDQPESASGLTGTPAYLAPEIFARQPATPRSDVYSLGALLFYLATGQYPVNGPSLRDLRDAHAQGIRTSLKSLRPDLPAGLIRAIEGALAVDPLRRFADADAMARALARGATAPRRMRTRLALAAAAMTLAAVAGGIWFMTPPRASPLTLEARDWVLVTAVDNRTGEDVLDGTLQFALERELAASTFVNVIPRQRLADALQLMQKPLDAELDITTSQEVALRDGAIRALIAGRVEKSGGRYAVSAQVVRPSDGTVVASIVEPPVEQAELLRTISDLALGVRERLGEALAAIPSPAEPALPRVTTSSLRALQLYSQVVAMESPQNPFGRKPEVAEQLLREAIREDPNFASAYRLLSFAVQLDGELRQTPRLAEALLHAERAVALGTVASHTERIRNELRMHTVRYATNPLGPVGRGHAARAIAACEALLQLEPRDVDALTSCTILYSRIGEPNAALAMRLAELRPTNFRWQVSAAGALMAEKPPRVDEARRHLDRARGLEPNPAGLSQLAAVRLLEADQAWLSNDTVTTLALLNQMADEIPSLPEFGRQPFSEALARAFLTLGQLKRAESMVATAGPQAQPNLLGIVLMGGQNRAALRALLSRRRVEDMTNNSSLLIEAGMLAEARQAITLIKRQPWVMGEDYLMMAEGQLAVAEGRHDDAIDAIEEQLRLTLPGTAFMRVWRGANTLATAWASKGNVPRAITVLEAIPSRSVQTTPVLSWGFEWLRVREQLAELYRSAGRLQEADRVERELLQLLAVADDDHPMKRRLVQRRSPN
jgi:tetratricopeptide (TPR) repeat protein